MLVSQPNGTLDCSFGLRTALLHGGFCFPFFSSSKSAYMQLMPLGTPNSFKRFILWHRDFFVPNDFPTAKKLSHQNDVQSSLWKVSESITFFYSLSVCVSFPLHRWCISIELLSEKLLSLHTPSSIHVVFNYSFFFVDDVFFYLSFFNIRYSSKAISLSVWYYRRWTENKSEYIFFFILHLWDERPKPEKMDELLFYVFGLNVISNAPLSNETMWIY